MQESPNHEFEIANKIASSIKSIAIDAVDFPETGTDEQNEFMKEVLLLSVCIGCAFFLLSRQGACIFAGSLREGEADHDDIFDDSEDWEESGMGRIKHLILSAAHNDASLSLIRASRLSGNSSSSSTASEFEISELIEALHTIQSALKVHESDLPGIIGIVTEKVVLDIAQNYQEVLQLDKTPLMAIFTYLINGRLRRLSDYGDLYITELDSLMEAVLQLGVFDVSGRFVTLMLEEECMCSDKSCLLHGNLPPLIKEIDFFQNN